MGRLAHALFRPPPDVSGRMPPNPSRLPGLCAGAPDEAPSVGALVTSGPAEFMVPGPYTPGGEYVYGPKRRRPPTSNLDALTVSRCAETPEPPDVVRRRQREKNARRREGYAMRVAQERVESNRERVARTFALGWDDSGRRNRGRAA
jgi:hypothetical protein